METPTRLTALEASFIAFERSGLPVHVAAIVLFKGAEPVTLPELRRLVASRLRRLPKFRQRLETGIGIQRARWVPVKRIDLGAHLFHHRLRAPGHRAQLFELCTRIHETLLSRDQPLWEMHLIDGLDGGGQALLIKTHHAITDGLAGVEIAEVLFDPAPGTRKPRLPVMRFGTNGAPSPLAALQAALGLAFTTAGGPLVTGGPFSGHVGAHRAFGAATLRMDVIQRIKRQLGCSVDDVVVAAVAAGLNAYLQEVRYPDIPSALRAMLPVSTRPSTRGVHLGNHVTAVFIDLPMHVDSLPSLVRTIAASKATLRAAHAAAGSTLLTEAAGRLPAPLHGALMRAVSDLPFANLVLSDVPGADAQLYLLGRRITACYPMMPLAADVGLSIATLSMDGVMGVGVTADPGLLPDPQRLAAAIERVLRESQHRLAPGKAA